MTENYSSYMHSCVSIHVKTYSNSLYILYLRSMQVSHNVLECVNGWSYPLMECDEIVSCASVYNIVDHSVHNDFEQVLTSVLIFLLCQVLEHNCTISHSITAAISTTLREARPSLQSAVKLSR